MFFEVMEEVKKKKPLVHNITNYVTANDVANAELAVGGFPIMADYYQEVSEITSSADALNINIGTLNEERLLSMIKAAKTANSRNKPVVLDLVGAGASEFRKNAVAKLLEKVSFSVIKGNISEIKAALFSEEESHGVDAREGSSIDLDFVDKMKNISAELGSVVIATGNVDIVADENNAYKIGNGSKDMAKVTGMGCMLSGILALYAGANPQNILKASVVAVVLSGVSGEIAKKRLLPGEGSGSFKVYFMDALSTIGSKDLEEMADCEII